MGLVNGVAQGLSLPLVPDAVWQSLLTTVGVAEPDGSASLATYLLDNAGDPVPSAEVVVPEGSTVAPLYDGLTSPNDWQSGGLTGDAGAILMLGVPADIATVSFDVTVDATLLTVSDVSVLPDVLTFVTVSLP